MSSKLTSTATIFLHTPKKKKNIELFGFDVTIYYYYFFVRYRLSNKRIIAVDVKYFVVQRNAKCIKCDEDLCCCRSVVFQSNYDIKIKLCSVTLKCSTTELQNGQKGLLLEKGFSLKKGHETYVLVLLTNLYF